MWILLMQWKGANKLIPILILGVGKASCIWHCVGHAWWPTSLMSILGDSEKCESNFVYQ